MIVMADAGKIAVAVAAMARAATLEAIVARQTAEMIATSSATLVAAPTSQSRLGTHMLVWGGATQGGIYNPMTDTWQPMTVEGSPSPVPNGPALLWIDEGMFAVGDGVGEYFDTYASALFTF